MLKTTTKDLYICFIYITKLLERSSLSWIGRYSVMLSVLLELINANRTFPLKDKKSQQNRVKKLTGWGLGGGSVDKSTCHTSVRS